MPTVVDSSAEVDSPGPITRPEFRNVAANGVMSPCPVILSSTEPSIVKATPSSVPNAALNAGELTDRSTPSLGEYTWLESTVS